MRRPLPPLLPAAVLGLILASGLPARANGDGINGYSGKGKEDCSKCHGAAGVGAATVGINIPKVLFVNSVTAFTVVVSGGPVMTARKGGIDVATDSPSAMLFGSGTTTKNLGGEIVHSVPGDLLANGLSYTLTIKPTAPGPLKIFASGIYSKQDKGDAGATGKAQVIVDVQVYDAGVPPNQAPVVKLVSPADGAIVNAGADVTLTATAMDPDGAIQKVEFYAGSELLGEATSVPYQLSWIHVGAGTYAITAKAYDTLGQSTVSAATSLTAVVTNTNQAPSVFISTPVTGSSVGVTRDVAVTVEASDPENQLARVQLFVDGAVFGELTTPPFQFTVPQLALGQHELVARAVDALEASGDSPPVKVSVTGTQPGSTDVAPLPGCGVAPGSGFAALGLVMVMLARRLSMKSRS